MDVSTMQRSQGPSGSSCGRLRRGLLGMWFCAVLVVWWRATTAAIAEVPGAAEVVCCAAESCSGS